jgi:hypothetical protein
MDSALRASKYSPLRGSKDSLAPLAQRDSALRASKGARSFHSRDGTRR